MGISEVSTSQVVEWTVWEWFKGFEDCLQEESSNLTKRIQICGEPLPQFCMRGWIEVQIIKVVSHCSIRSATNCEEEWAYWHNQLTDQAAVAVNTRRPDEFLGSVGCTIDCADRAAQATHGSFADATATESFCSQGPAERNQISCPSR